MRKYVSSLVIALFLSSFLFACANVKPGSSLDEHDVGIANVVIDYSVTWYNLPSRVNVTIANYGSYDEVCNLTVYANMSAPSKSYTIGIVNDINLTFGTTETMTFSWDGTHYVPGYPTPFDGPYGPYTISAILSRVPGEINTTNNLFVGGIIRVTGRYDVDGDTYGSVLDLIKVASRLGETPPFGFTYPIPCRVDVNNDGKVNVLDLMLVARTLTTGHAS